MSFEMNMLNMYHVHHLCTETEGKDLQKCLKAHLIILIKLLYSKYRMSNITKKIIKFSAEARKVTLIIWLKLKEEVCHLVVEG